jgi:protein-S-isoprenylcysteine O-methyltransferase Ste14
MSILQPWNVVFFLGLVLYVGIRGRFARQTKTNEQIVRQVGVQEMVLLSAVILTSLLLPVLYLFTPLLRFADYELPSWMQWCGSGVMVAALWLFWRSHADLGLNWSATLEIRKGHEITQEGVYTLIRHPMYAAIWLWCIAQGMLLENWLAGWAALVAFAIMYFLRTPREEEMMREHFGKAYEDYAAETGRLFPRRLSRKPRRG